MASALRLGCGRSRTRWESEIPLRSNVEPRSWWPSRKWIVPAVLLLTKRPTIFPRGRTRAAWSQTGLPTGQCEGGGRERIPAVGYRTMARVRRRIDMISGSRSPRGRGEPQLLCRFVKSWNLYYSAVVPLSPHPSLRLLPIRVPVNRRASRLTKAMSVRNGAHGDENFEEG